MTTILGIDPGLAETGYGIIRVDEGRISYVCHGTISTKPELGTGGRLRKIHSEVERVIAQYSPDACAVESLYFAKNITSALPVAQARGVVLLAIAQAGMDAHEFPPQKIKQAITGSGRADKKQVQHMVVFLLSLQEIPQPDHAADALAAAICCYHTIDFDAHRVPKTGKMR